ncbi:MAG: hypothetical protein A2X86_19640 [Bdellovibrionales bacterium GWA2_49_15]|nr:MAG: hypothetical protein A2X86_19640 [Bdellovibrionales bacterium GWA2_49_15]HAZ13795.1 hypothetical protein [Bdellovibrionales bacterium]
MKIVMKTWIIAWLVCGLASHAWALEEYERDGAVQLPESVIEYRNSLGKGEDNSSIKYKAIEDLKNVAEMSVIGKDTIRGLQYLAIATDLFPFRKDIVQRKGQVLDMAIKSTTDLAKLKDKNCNTVSRRISFILSVAPDVTTLQEAKRFCMTKAIAKKKKTMIKEIISAKIPLQKLDLSETDCTKGNGDECVALGTLAEQQKHIFAAKKYYIRACYVGNSEGCFRIGLIEFNNVNTEAESRKYFIKAADGGIGRAYIYLGTLERSAGHILEAKQYYIKACDGGVLHGCMRLGMLEEEQGDKPGAKKTYIKACDGGEYASCGFLAFLYKHEGNKIEEQKYFAMACEGGHYASCMNIGNILEAQSNWFEAKKYYSIGCSDGWRGDCDGMKRVEGMPVDTLNNSKKIGDVYRKSCTGDDNAFACDQCLHRGEIEYKRGNKSEAKKYFLAACPKGDEDGCKDLKDLDPVLFHAGANFDDEFESLPDAK